MSNRTNFSSTVSALADSKSGNKESALASLGFMSVTSGFYFMIFSLTSLFFTIIIGAVFYIYTINAVKQTEEMFTAYGNHFLKNTSAMVQSAAISSKYATLSKLIKGIYEGQDSEKKQIQEIFFLDKKGSVLAHTDLTRVTTTANKSINRLSSIYNNELFHSALMVPEGEVYIQSYPYEHFNKDRGFVYLMRYILPKNYFDAMDFSMPIFVKKQPAGTFHVILSRIYMDQILRSTLLMMLNVWLASVVVAGLLAMFFKIPITKKMKKLNIFVKNYLTQDVDQYIEKVEKAKIREEIEYIDARIADLTKSATKEQQTLMKEKNVVKDAYLIREH